MFVMAQLPYLQPFDDVNKRVSRLAANIPLIKANFVPLSFEDVPRDLYTEAILGVYEMKRVELLRDVFIWAYGRSAARYAAVRQSLGEPDPFRLQYRSELRDVIGRVIRGRTGQEAGHRLRRRLDAGAHRSGSVRAVPGSRRERAAEPARGQFRPLPGQAVRIRGVAGGLDRFVDTGSLGFTIWCSSPASRYESLGDAVRADRELRVSLDHRPSPHAIGVSGVEHRPPSVILSVRESLPYRGCRRDHRSRSSTADQIRCSRRGGGCTGGLLYFGR